MLASIFELIETILGGLLDPITNSIVSNIFDFILGK